ncbi:CPBP family intramembrane metalloprotease [Paenibacillus mesophilus]|uniref:CPBP family intramembrane glutamic endopeptidase n=1 Tax=Paenibacillus mesophilus TaxID=2582849 RepID=UPI00110E0178|nr:CPBP family intramembrane glutamic endopeptidase [Paenibacillus mesophilus]TMV45913.1 CPBP family intramembrane metalloprotease [Paenibacillus mesophilus]
MPRPQSSRLGTLAIIGILLFAVTNWWPLLTGKENKNAITETRPTVTKQAAAVAAKSYVERAGGGKTNRASVVYQSNKLLSGYVQKERLTADYNSRFLGRVPIDFYRVELTTDRNADYLVDVNMTNGSVIGWQTRSKGEAPSVREGRRIAESYLRQAGKTPDDYQAFNPNTSSPYQFAFEHRSDKLGEAKLREIVEIRDGQVTAFRTELRVPDSHYDWVKRQDRTASYWTQWNMTLSALMGIAAIVFAIVYRKQISFVRGIWLTITFLVLYWINNVNMLPAFKTLDGPAADPFLASDEAVVMVMVMNVVVAVLGIIGYFSLAAGEPLWRGMGLNVWPRWREAGFGRDTLDSMKRGYLLALLILGIQSLLFFIAEQRFDMWAVNDPSGSMYNLLRPELFPLMAWTAAISEEAVYRFFGIALFKKLLYFRFLAILVPSIIWALSHTQYPIYPVYTRLVEVTILGIVFGYAFLKFGFATVLFAHATMDSLLMSFSLMNMGGTGDVALGLFYIAMPALVAWIIWRLHRILVGRRSTPLT